MSADEAARTAVQRRSSALTGWAVLPLKLGVQVRAAQPPLQLTAAAIAASISKPPRTMILLHRRNRVTRRLGHPAPQQRSGHYLAGFAPATAAASVRNCDSGAFPVTSNRTLPVS